MIAYIVITINFVATFLSFERENYGWAVVHLLIILSVIWIEYMIERKESE